MIVFPRIFRRFFGHPVSIGQVRIQNPLLFSFCTRSLNKWNFFHPRSLNEVDMPLFSFSLFIKQKRDSKHGMLSRFGI